MGFPLIGFSTDDLLGSVSIVEVTSIITFEQQETYYLKLKQKMENQFSGWSSKKNPIYKIYEPKYGRLKKVVDDKYSYWPLTDNQN